MADRVNEEAHEEMPAANRAAGIVVWATLFSLAYAVTRYHLAGPVPWKDFPFFILNLSLIHI